MENSCDKKSWLWKKTDKKGKKKSGVKDLKIFFTADMTKLCQKTDKLPREESYVVCHTDHDRERRRTDRSTG